MARLRLRGKKTTKELKRNKKRPKDFLLSTKFLATVLVVVGLAGFAMSGYYWYQKSFTNTDRIFYGMISKSLDTRSITRTIVQEEASRTDAQNTFLQFSPETMVGTKASVEQVDTNRQASRVATETIGTKTADYIRYTDVSLPNSDSNSVDYSKIVNIWAKRDNNPEQGEVPQTLNEASFTFVPFGNFSPDDRQKIINLIKEKQAYTLSNDNIVYENGRPILTLNASIKPKALVEVMREYAEMTGIGNKDQLDPSQYSNSSTFTIKLRIDVITRHLKQVVYPNDERTEDYDAYGLTLRLAEPKESISVDELQGKLQ